AGRRFARRLRVRAHVDSGADVRPRRAFRRAGVARGGLACAGFRSWDAADRRSAGAHARTGRLALGRQRGRCQRGGRAALRARGVCAVRAHFARDRLGFRAPMARILIIASLLFLLAPAAAEAATVKVYFTKGEQLASVDRDIPNGSGIVTATVQELLKGPTPAETRAGSGSAIPAGSTLASAQIDAPNRLAILDFSGTFGSAKKLPDSDAAFREVYGARLAQVVYTVSAL